MKISKKILGLSAGFSAMLGATLIAVSCGQTPQTPTNDNPGNGSNTTTYLTDAELLKQAQDTLTDWSGELSITYEANWKPVMDALIKSLPAELRSRVKLTEIKNDSSTTYIDTVEQNGSEASDLFPVQLDRVQTLITKNLIAAIPQRYLGNYKKTQDIVKFNNNYYGYPLNVESVIQFYNKTIQPTAITDSTDMLKNPVAKKFVVQAGNMWHGSVFVNGLFSTIQGSPENSNKEWVTYSDDGKVATAPFLQNNTVKERLKVIYNYYQELRKSGDENWIGIANNGNRFKRVVEGLATGNIGVTYDGMWILGDLIGYLILKDKDNPAKVVENINNISVAALPNFGTEKTRHFVGGWAYALNRASLTGITDQKARTGKTNFANYIASRLTSKELSGQWITNAGKYSAADDAQIKVNINSLSINDFSTTDENDKIDLSRYIAQEGFTSAIDNLYSSVTKALVEQSSLNVAQPKWPGSGYWEAWDGLGFSDKQYTTFDAFFDAFTANINLELAKVK
ncbi:hypothetical protein EI74_0029 [Mycoplasma testudineum]|uniref:ABC-type glycerol-3-phosphate transport system substrate-binding protein n=1 Tax=Mycoplasma testudineum TaxID=244584 RepID=A0A4R6IJF8_9MOLU|nr:hypothetical protein [Mycoplasma testudineum]OYD26434.1 hypothetical protein CG473_03955 [Mycoplasma testudineum]TDO22123.1 hypothetical protein EI74_0029 [Mycoplasma testudineum]